MQAQDIETGIVCVWAREMGTGGSWGTIRKGEQKGNGEEDREDIFCVNSITKQGPLYAGAVLLCTRWRSVSKR